MSSLRHRCDDAPMEEGSRGRVHPEGADGQLGRQGPRLAVTSDTAPAGEEAHAPGPPSARHALLWGLRRRADEGQLTQAIAAIARVDRHFGARFVQLLLDAAERGSSASNVEAFRAGGLPEEL